MVKTILQILRTTFTAISIKGQAVDVQALMNYIAQAGTSMYHDTQEQSLLEGQSSTSERKIPALFSKYIRECFTMPQSLIAKALQLKVRNYKLY